MELGCGEPPIGRLRNAPDIKSTEMDVERNELEDECARNTNSKNCLEMNWLCLLLIPH